MLAKLITVLFGLALADMQDLGSKKLETMRKLQAKAKDGIIEFNKEQYE